MAFRSRAFLMLSVVLLTGMAVFAYDSAVRGMWAGLAFAVVACLVLLGVIGASRGSGAVSEPPAGQTGFGAGEDLRALLDQVPIPLVRCVEGRHPEAVNRAARSLFQTDDVITPDTGALMEAIGEATQGSKAMVAVFGRQYALSVSEVVSGQGLARLASLTDVQMEIHKAEAAALRDTLHILSHEIMNSLTPVASLAEVAQACLTQAPEDLTSARDALETLSRRAANLTRFIEAYRSVARLPDPILQPVDPARLVEDILALFQRAPANARVRFDVSTGAALPRLDLDEALISQAIINVVTNAIEAAGTSDRSPEVAVHVGQVRRNIVIRISDNGDGVPDSLRPNLFNGFATTKPNGTGTGLNLARQITLVHGGNLHLEASAPGMTAFVFTFPVRA